MPQADKMLRRSYINPQCLIYVLTYTTSRLQHFQRTRHHDGDTHDEFHTLNGYDNLWSSRDDLQVRVTR